MSEETVPDRGEWPLWEIFIRSAHGLAHKHVGSLHAADGTMALENARDVYTRRSEGQSVWVVRSTNIIASRPGERESFLDPAADKAYRHATYYAVPEGVKNL